MIKILLGVITLAVLLAAAVFTKDMNIYEDGSFTGTLPYTQAWRD
jgi:hypothetical protein